MRYRIIAGVVCIALSIAAADREYYGAVMEPPSRCISGAGQVDPESFLGYCSAMTNATLPLINMQYKSVDKDPSSIITTQKARYETIEAEYPWIRVIPQYGISMTHDGSPHQHYEHKVADGEYDENLRAICENLKALDRPLYLRIGYECNGSWNGYEPESYRRAFRYVANMVREYSIPAAIVWNVYPPAVPMEYYPGDEYVDWWSIDLFDKNDAPSSNTRKFLDSAHAHGKPVMIGESTPRGTGTDDGKSDWDDWFAPYFELIETSPGIKAFSYINWNWNDSPWSSWGDARIENSAYISNAFAEKMESELYLHAPAPADKPAVSLWKMAVYEKQERTEAVMVTRTGNADRKLIVRYTLRPLESNGAPTVDSIVIAQGKYTAVKAGLRMHAPSRKGETVAAQARLSEDPAYGIALPSSAHIQAIGSDEAVKNKSKKQRKSPRPLRRKGKPADIRTPAGRRGQATPSQRCKEMLPSLPAGAYIIHDKDGARIIAQP